MPRETVFFYPYKIRLADSLVFILDLHAGDGAFCSGIVLPPKEAITPTHVYTILPVSVPF